MFDFEGEFPEKYRDCFEKPKLLKQYLQETEFIYYLDIMLYKSQIYYFRDFPDHTGEFLLKYRAPLIRALERFEVRKISLSSYIGETLRYYRLNFYKQMSNKEKQKVKTQACCIESMLEKLDIYSRNYTGESSFAHIHRDLHSLHNNILENREFTEEYLGENPLKKYSNKYFVEEIIKRVHSDISHRKLKGRKVSVSESKILLILLILSEEELPPKKQRAIFCFIGISEQQYNSIIKNRNNILQRLLDKKREQGRLLDRCFFNYLAEQEESDEKRLLIPTKKEKLYNRLKNLQCQYLQMKTILSRQQVAKLADIPPTDIPKYYRYLKRLLAE